jgi:hypothetical protein
VAALRFVYGMFKSAVVINLSDETIDRVIKGLKVRATIRPATPTQWFDVSILFRKLAVEDCLSFPYSRLCEFAPAVLMGAIPSRPDEVASLTFGNITIIWNGEAPPPPSNLCTFLASLPLHDNDLISPHLQRLRHLEFTFDLLLINAKNDYKRDGLPKPIVHYSGHLFSPALFLLVYAIRHAQRILRETKSIVTGDYSFFSWFNDVKKKLSSDSISNRVTKIAINFCGAPRNVTARSWRIASANALIDAGVSIERVAKIGGWKDINTLRQHYLRWRPMAKNEWLSASGNPAKITPNPLISASKSLSKPKQHSQQQDITTARRSTRVKRTPARFED